MAARGQKCHAIKNARVTLCILSSINTHLEKKAYEPHLLQMKFRHQVLSSFFRKPKEMLHIGNASVLLSILQLCRPVKSVMLQAEADFHPRGVYRSTSVSAAVIQYYLHEYIVSQREKAALKKLGEIKKRKRISRQL